MGKLFAMGSPKTVSYTHLDKGAQCGRTFPERVFQLFPAFFREFLALFLVHLVCIRADGVVHFGVHVVFRPLFQREQFIEASEDLSLIHI